MNMKNYDKNNKKKKNNNFLFDDSVTFKKKIGIFDKNIFLVMMRTHPS